MSTLAACSSRKSFEKWCHTGASMLLDYRVKRPSNAYDRGVDLPSDHSLARRLYLRLGKPVLDRICAVVLLIFLLPVMSGIALVLRLALGRGVLLRQVRIGQGGEPFELVKFRTMTP